MTITEIMKMSAKELNTLKRKDMLRVIKGLKDIYQTIKFDKSDIDACNMKIILAEEQIKKYQDAYSTVADELGKVKTELSYAVAELNSLSTNNAKLSIELTEIKKKPIYKFLRFIGACK
jgi:DNA repair ATPase RecN